MICERVPKSCVALLRLVLEKNGVTVTEQRLTIAIFEFMAIPMARLQWGAEWKKLGILHVYFYIDNSNACVWLQKGFSSSPIAQDLCRIVAANEFAYGFVCTAVWTPTKVNLINDTRSRVLHDGKVDQEAVDLLEQLNAALDEPYFEEPMCDDAKGLMEHLEQMHSCYDVIALYKRTSPVFSSVAPLAGPSMAQQLQDYREGFSYDDERKFCAAATTAFTAAHFGVGVGLMRHGCCRAGIVPLYSSEVCPLMSAMDEWVTGARCMPNAFHVDPKMLPKVNVAVFTFPCIDFCPLANNMLGENGTTGWMTATGIVKILSAWHSIGWLPEVVVVEINGNSLNVNGGAGMQQLVDGLEQHYVVHKHLNG